MTRRTPEALYNKKRSDEGDDLERWLIPHVLHRDGYDPIARSHMSRGPFDWLAAKPGQLLVISSRLIRAGAATPHLTHTERANIWHYVETLTNPGLDVIALIAGAEHAPAWSVKDQQWRPCRCSPKLPTPDPDTALRLWRLTGPPAAGSGRRPAQEPWTTDFAQPAVQTRFEPLPLEGAA